METVHRPDKSYTVPQVPTPVKPEFEILSILKKIHFWVKFWSIVTIVAIILFLISQVMSYYKV
ncbi:MAG: hypothetical protein MUO72_13650 [Bacteroidales bacterium]|nr:hypothetical protein [Bacteroidales bacterium]